MVIDRNSDVVMMDLSSPRMPKGYPQVVPIALKTTLNAS